MDKKETKRKYLLSIALLLISVGLLVTSTFAWFTDTATVTGSVINAGNLKVDLYADEEKLKLQWLGEDEGHTDAGWASAKTGWITAKGYTEIAPLADTTKHLYKVTGKNLALINIDNVEPGQVYPVKNIGVYNTGELAISYVAGFKIETSKTGLENYFSGTADAELLASLLTKQAEKDADGNIIGGTWTAYDANKTHDKGGKLEDVLRVYAWDGTDFSATNPINNTIVYVNELGEVSATGSIIDETAPKYIGTVSQLIHANDAAYIASLNEYTDAEEIATLLAVQDRIKSAASGICLPASAEELEGKKADEKAEITIHEYNANGTSGDSYTKEVGQMGELNFLIVMPKNAGNEYQNALLKLSIGATATQVNYEKDGTGYAFYDK